MLTVAGMGKVKNHGGAWEAEMKSGDYDTPSDRCIYPDCFHCILPDCEVYGVFPGECRRNAECGELPGRKKRHAEDHMLPELR